MVSTIVVVYIVRNHWRFPTNVTCFHFSKFDWARRWYCQLVYLKYCWEIFRFSIFWVLGIVLRNINWEFCWEYFENFCEEFLWKSFPKSHCLKCLSLCDFKVMSKCPLCWYDFEVYWGWFMLDVCWHAFWRLP